MQSPVIHFFFQRSVFKTPLREKGKRQKRTGRMEPYIFTLSRHPLSNTCRPLAPNLLGFSHSFSEDENQAGYNIFTDFANVMKPENGFAVRGSLTFQVRSAQHV